MSDLQAEAVFTRDDSPSPDAVSDRRAHRRYPTLLPATVETTRGVLTLVTVMDLSGGGALLRFPLGTAPQDEFDLAISTGGDSALLHCQQTSSEESWTGTLVHVCFERLTAQDHSFISAVLSVLRPEFDDYQHFLVARSND
ncbi:MAG: PilZ domain-containing protein [Dehalococcoidia bacterium]